MKNYRITVNGKVYDVIVEEAGSGFTPAPSPAVVPAAPAAAKAVSAPAPAPSKAAAPSQNEGSVEISASVPGKIIKIDAPEGTKVSAGDTVITVEAMKMEIPVVAPQEGTIASVRVKAGDSVESGSVLATMD